MTHVQDCIRVGHVAYRKAAGTPFIPSKNAVHLHIDPPRVDRKRQERTGSVQLSAVRVCEKEIACISKLWESPSTGESARCVCS